MYRDHPQQRPHIGSGLFQWHASHQPAVPGPNCIWRFCPWSAQAVPQVNHHKGTSSIYSESSPHGNGFSWYYGWWPDNLLNVALAISLDSVAPLKTWTISITHLVSGSPLYYASLIGFLFPLLKQCGCMRLRPPLNVVKVVWSQWHPPFILDVFPPVLKAVHLWSDHSGWMETKWKQVGESCPIAYKVFGPCELLWEMSQLLCSLKKSQM